MSVPMMIGEYVGYVVQGAVFMILWEAFKTLALAMSPCGWVAAISFLINVTEFIMLIDYVSQLIELLDMYLTTGDIYYLQELGVQVAALATLSIASKLFGNKINELKDMLTKAVDEAGLSGTCFVAGTLVSTPNGNIPIENITDGMLVYSFNSENLEISENTVEEVFVRETTELININIGSETIRSTPDHPFYVPQKGFINAVELRAGDILLNINGDYVIIEEIQHEILESPITVYNFRVANVHTYFVGNAKIGVHNAEYGQEIPWYDKSAKRANAELDSMGNAKNKSVTVDSQAAAEELFLNRYAGEGYRNTTGMSASEVKDLYGSKANTYHWDTVRGTDGLIEGHGTGNPDGLWLHLQIYDSFGNKTTIFFYD